MVAASYLEVRLCGAVFGVVSAPQKKQTSAAAATRLRCGVGGLRFGTVAAFVAAPLAYIDPGTGSMLLQVIVGGVAAAAVGLRLFWSRLIGLFRIRRREEPRTRSST